MVIRELTLEHQEGKFAEELAVIKPATTFWIDKIKNDVNEDGSGYSPYMNGNFVFKNAVVNIGEYGEAAPVCDAYDSSGNSAK